MQCIYDLKIKSQLLTCSCACIIVGDSGLRERRDAVLQRLDKIAYRAAKDRNRKPVEGTCRWAVEHRMFQEWKNAPSSAFLWLSADPGCGKSVLARHMVDSVLADRHPYYFFFKDGYSGQTTADSALSCILHQILATRDSLFSEEILRRFEVSSQIYQSTVDLWDVLETLARVIGSEMICILDTFDECKDEDRDVLARLLREFYAHRSAGSNLKFLVTSRPYHNIRHNFRIEFNIPVIHLNGETPEESQKIAKEIDIFMEWEIAEMETHGRLSNADADSLWTWMHRVTNRTYLWAYLVLAEINNRPGEHFTLVLSELPKTVNDAYEKMLTKTSTRYQRHQVEKLLHIVLAATRPLSIDEMYIALTIEEQHKCHKDIGSPGQDFEIYIREVCGLFVYIVDSKVYLFHQTAREFLVSADDARHPPAESTARWQHSLQSKTSNLVLYQSCARYLLLIEADTDSSPKSITQYPFYQYCVTSWAQHCRCSDPRNLELVLKLLQIQDSPHGSPLPGRWFSAYWKLKHDKDADRSFTPFIVASYFGLLDAVRHIIQKQNINVNKLERYTSRSALSFAAENGFTEVADALLSINRKGSWRFLHLRRLDINTACSEGQTPLIYAASNGHVDTVRLLISARAETDIRDKLDETALSYGLAYGHTPVVEELAGNDTVDDMSETIQTLLFKAVKMGSYAGATRLLDNGADVDGRDPKGFTPLTIAIIKEDEDMVRLLLKNGARPYTTDDDGYTPYYHSIFKSDHILKAISENLNPADFTKYSDPREFLNTKTPSDIPDSYTELAIVHSCRVGYDHIARQLLNCHSLPHSFLYREMRKAESDNCFFKLLQEKTASTDVLTRTRFLRKALQEEHEIVFEYLVNSGVDFEERGYGGEPVIFDAVRQGNSKVLQTLINSGASTETRSSFGFTPLHEAASLGLEDIGRVLLDNDAKIEAVDDLHNTPLITSILHYVAVGGWQGTEMTELLLSFGADAEVRTRKGETILEIAIAHSSSEMVVCLLQRGTDANAVNSTGESLLQYARSIQKRQDSSTLAREGSSLGERQRKIIQLLTAYGATDY